MIKTKTKQPSKINHEFLSDLGMDMASQKIMSIIAEKHYKKLSEFKNEYCHNSGQYIDFKYKDNNLEFRKTSHENEYGRNLYYDIKDYLYVPPTDVLEKFKKAKDLGIFEKFLIVDIKEDDIDDPLLIGVVYNKAYLIAEWEVDFL